LQWKCLGFWACPGPLSLDGQGAQTTMQHQSMEVDFLTNTALCPPMQRWSLSYPFNSESLTQTRCHSNQSTLSLTFSNELINMQAAVGQALAQGLPGVVAARCQWLAATPPVTVTATPTRHHVTQVAQLSLRVSQGWSKPFFGLFKTSAPHCILAPKTTISRTQSFNSSCYDLTNTKPQAQVPNP